MKNMIKSAALVFAVFLIVSACTPAASDNSSEISETTVPVVTDTTTLPSTSAETTTTSVPVTQPTAPPAGIVYLTIDDGPSSLTPLFLEVLAEKQVRATFFVTRKEDEELRPYYRQIIDAGHQLALHSASHNYSQIYKDIDAFFADYGDIQEYIYHLTGLRLSAYRFPGGTSYPHLLRPLRDDIFARFREQDIPYYDWNVSSGDGAAAMYPPEKLVTHVVDGVLGRGAGAESVVLMHDADNKPSTAEALPEIIDRLAGAGYVFDILENLKIPVHQRE